MANQVMAAYRNILGTTGQPNLLTADIRVVMIDTGAYTFNPAHDFLDDVPGAARIGTSAALTTKTFGTVATGVFDADDATFSAVSGATVEALYLIVNTGVDSTSRLLMWLDTVSGLVFTPSGGNAILQWNASGVFIL